MWQHSWPGTQFTDVLQMKCVCPVRCSALLRRSPWLYPRLESSGLHCFSRLAGGSFHKVMLVQTHYMQAAFLPGWWHNLRYEASWQVAVVQHHTSDILKWMQCQSRQLELRMTCPQLTETQWRPVLWHCLCFPEKSCCGPWDDAKHSGNEPQLLSSHPPGIHSRNINSFFKTTFKI